MVGNLGIAIGTLSAVYLTPIVVSWFNLDATRVSSTNGIAFGMSLAEGAVRLVQRWAANPKLPEELSIKGFAQAANPEKPELSKQRLKSDQG
jgi:hypothetical protein